MLCFRKSIQLRQGLDFIMQNAAFLILIWKKKEEAKENHMQLLNRFIMKKLIEKAMLQRHFLKEKANL